MSLFDVMAYCRLSEPALIAKVAKKIRTEVVDAHHYRHHATQAEVMNVIRTVVVKGNWKRLLQPVVQEIERQQKKSSERRTAASVTDLIADRVESRAKSPDSSVGQFYRGVIEEWFNPKLLLFEPHDRFPHSRFINAITAIRILRGRVVIFHSARATWDHSGAGRPFCHASIVLPPMTMLVRLNTENQLYRKDDEDRKELRESDVKRERNHNLAQVIAEVDAILAKRDAERPDLVRPFVLRTEW